MLGRYERGAAGNVIIDVSAPRIEDLYNDFDRSAPYRRRDLDRDFAEYLIACARELNRIPFRIRLTLDASPDESRLSRIQHSLNTYFEYLREEETQKLQQMFRRSAVLFAIGLAILFASVWLNRLLGAERSVTANVFAEGLTVAAWVSLWESLAVFLIEWFPLRRNIGLYRNLARAKLGIRTQRDALAHHTSG